MAKAIFVGRDTFFSKAMRQHDAWMQIIDRLPCRNDDQISRPGYLGSLFRGIGFTVHNHRIKARCIFKRGFHRREALHLELWRNAAFSAPPRPMGAGLLLCVGVVAWIRQ